MKIGTLFSGIGAPEQGAMRVYDDLEHVFACEYDKFARQSFNAIYDIDQDHFHNDVREMDGKQYRGKVDVLVGGSPCQAFSIAGLREGTDDERGQLIYQYIRVVEEVMSPVIVYENVKGMLSISGGRTIREFVQALRDIGYFCHYDVVNTKDYGVPQNRERVFLVGFLDGEQYLRFRYAEAQKLEKRLLHVLEDKVDDKYYLSEKALNGFKTHAQRMKERGNGFKIDPSNGDAVASSVTTRAGGRSDDNFIDVVGLLDIKGTEQIRRVYGVNGCAATLTTMQGGNQEPKILDSGRKILNHRIRKLTPLECWRLQDFPDTAHAKAKEAGLSDSQLYKQAGNSMSVNVLEMIFRQIEASRFKDEGRLF